jgi:hypothetical protein
MSMVSPTFASSNSGRASGRTTSKNGSRTTDLQITLLGEVVICADDDSSGLDEKAFKRGNQ